MTVAQVSTDGVASGNSQFFGIREALREGYALLDAIAEGLAAGARENPVMTAAPFHFDSRRLCMLAYQSALREVRWRFWTTTYLSSGFWGGSNSDILHWNREALRRLTQSGTAGRRLFLLPSSPEAEIRRWCDQRILMQKYDDAAGLADLDRRFANLCGTVAELSALGCEVRSTQDIARRHKALPDGISMDGLDSELAIYDEWRFDLFHGGRSGTIQSVNVYTPVMQLFESHFRCAVDYFEQLWRDASPMSDLLDRIKETLNHTTQRIDYHPIWLARYDHALPKHDDILKRSEFRAVERTLRRRALWGGLSRVLDVGTCTARYPIGLRDAVASDGEIFGVDNDRDAVRFARRNVADLCNADARIHIEQFDFCAGEFALPRPFDLITCMLGTLLHFSCDGAAAGPPYEDGLQRALDRFAALLSDNGVVFFSIWTAQARRERRVLSIYSEEDKRRLAAWRVTSRQLHERLRAAGLKTVARERIEHRMELYCCMRESGADARVADKDGESEHGGDSNGERRRQQRRLRAKPKLASARWRECGQAQR